LLAIAGIEVISHVVAIGDVKAPDVVPTPDDAPAIEQSPVRCLTKEAEERMIAAIDQAKSDRDTLGGVVEVLAFNVMPGLGSHVHFDRKLDGRLAGALMSIPAIKAVEVGDGFESAARRGSAAHDEIDYERGQFERRTNRAGGIEGGMSNGDVLRLRAAMKPISTLMRPLDTVDVTTKVPDKAIRERSDVCAVPAAGVVAESMVAIVLGQELQRKFGGDTVGDLAAAIESYRKRLADY
jgi:chorismate synthase